ncbi:MAG: NAD(+)/NADH kinase [Anaerolineae bacterium]|nr:NAD(+)/NADH kinase [Anaerolineae bacterium]
MNPDRTHRLGILHHPKLPHSLDLAEDVALFLRERGHAAWIGSSWDPEGVTERLAGTDVIITLGGDGTILRAARVCAAASVPILGVNLGRLGYLAELEPGSWRRGLEEMLAGGHWIEERMMLISEHWRREQVLGSFPSLNEVVVGRGRLARVVRIVANVDGAEVARYVADGLIASTPTGSTAYAFAAGGPIMPPTIRNILLVPIAPMFGLARPVVLSQGAIVRLTVETDHEAILTVDGQLEVPLESGDEVTVRAADYVARFVRLRPPSYFYQSLSTRLRCL